MFRITFPIRLPSLCRLGCPPIFPHQPPPHQPKGQFFQFWHVCLPYRSRGVVSFPASYSQHHAFRSLDHVLLVFYLRDLLFITVLQVQPFLFRSVVPLWAGNRIIFRSRYWIFPDWHSSPPLSFSNFFLAACPLLFSPERVIWGLRRVIAALRFVRHSPWLSRSCIFLFPVLNWPQLLSSFPTPNLNYSPYVPVLRLFPQDFRCPNALLKSVTLPFWNFLTALHPRHLPADLFCWNNSPTNPPDENFSLDSPLPETIRWFQRSPALTSLAQFKCTRSPFLFPEKGFSKTPDSWLDDSSPFATVELHPFVILQSLWSFTFVYRQLLL